VFRKTEQVNGLDVLVYYWDDRDGPNFCGWWFGPKVGGDQVWAYNSERAMTPPTTGWRVPYDGPVDSTFVVSVHAGGDKARAQYGQQAGYQVQQQPAGYVPGQPMQQQLQQMQQHMQQQQQQQHPQMQHQMGSQYDMQERVRQQQQEEARKRQQMEAARAQQIQELQRREAERKEEERRRLEQSSALVVRKVIGKVRYATPEDFELIKKEIEDALLMELPKCGMQADRIREDAERQVEQARVRIEGVKEMRRREESRRQEEEQLQREQEETMRRLLAELGELVGKAEKDSERLKEAAAPVLDAPEGKDLGPEESGPVVKALGEVVVDAKASGKACTEFLVVNREKLLQGTTGTAIYPTSMEVDGQAKPFFMEAKGELLKLQGRIQECFKVVISSVDKTRAVHDNAVKKAKAVSRYERRAALFDKYDKDKDGALSKKEIASYAKAEFGFGIPTEAFPKLLAQLATINGCVPKDRFQRLKIAIGILREEEAARQRRKEAEERRKVLEEKKQALQADVNKVTDSLDEVEPEVKKAEEKAQPLAAEELGAAEQVLAAAEATKAQLDAARSEIATVRRQIADLSNGVDEALKDFIAQESRQLEAKAEHLEARLQQVAAAVQRGNAHLQRLEQMELDKLSAGALKALRDHQTSKKISVEDFFVELDADKDELLSKAEFLGFFKASEGFEFDSEKMERLFNRFAGESGSIAKDTFLKLVRVHYYVIKETLLTTEMGVKEGKAIRRLDVDEVLAVHEGPHQDETLGITRMRACAVKDDIMGWATVVGNTGGVFLEIGGNTFEVAMDAPLTATMEPDSEMVRQLKVGEKLDILDWDKKHEASGLARLRVRVLGGDGAEGASGWVTKALLDETRVIRPTPGF